MKTIFRGLALLVLVAGVLLGVRGFGVMRGTDDFGREPVAPCPPAAEAPCDEHTAGNQRTRSGIALMIAGGFGLGMGLTLLIIAGRIGRVPHQRWFETRWPPRDKP